MKRQFKKADQVKAVNQDHQSKYNKVTHKNDDLVKAEVQDKLDGLEESIENESTFTLRELEDAFNAGRLMDKPYKFHFEDFKDWYRSELQSHVELTGRGYSSDNEY